MAQIQTYPRKTTYDANDLILICDKTPDANGVVTNDTKTTTISTITDNLNVVDTVTASGSGITASPNKGNVVITNTGVTSLTAGTNISLSGSTGAITISTSASNVDGSGTAGTIPKWSDSNTLTDSIIKDQGGEDIIIPRFIKHDGDLNNAFGFSNASEFIVSVGPSTADQFLVSQNAIIMKTESGTKVATGPVGVTLYSDTSDTQTTTSVARFATTTTGAIVYGQTIAQGAASERGGIIRFNNNANDRFVGISGPVTTGTSYEIVLPDAVGTASQVLKLPSTIGATPHQLAWGDAGAGGLTSTANGGTGVSISSPQLNGILIGDGSSAFAESNDIETAIQLPVGITARRPTANASNVGLIRYNTTLAKFEGVQETGVGTESYAWVQFTSSS